MEEASYSYKDRTGGLIAFGILELLLGAGFLSFIGLFLLTLRLRPASLAPGYPPPNLAPALLLYGGLAVVFGCLGVGSILSRRWACALSATLGWLWLLGGTIGGVFLLVLMPRMLAVMPGMPPGGKLGFLGCMAVLWVVLTVLLPLALALFYSGENARRTCAARDPRPRWTDRCPLPVLILAVACGYGALALAVASLHPVFPFFGRTLTGAAAAAAVLVFAGIEALLAWGLYRLRPAAWWGLLAVWLWSGASSAITFYRGIDWNLVMRASGQQDTPAVQQVLDAIFRGPFFLAFAGAFAVACLGYLLWIRRYFAPRPA